MPWKVVKDSGKCDGSKPYAVVKDDGSNDLVGCHASEADADAHLKALYANEPSANWGAPSSSLTGLEGL